jgi:hypothetical protein
MSELDKRIKSMLRSKDCCKHDELHHALSEAFATVHMGEHAQFMGRIASSMAFAEVITLCRSWMTRLSPALLLIVCTGGFFFDAGFGVGLGCGFGCGIGCGFGWGFECGCVCGFAAGLGVGFGLAAWMVLLLLLLDTGLAVGLPGAGWVAVFGMILPSAVVPVTGAGAGAGVDASPGAVAVAVVEPGPGAGAPVRNVGVPAGGTADGALHKDGTGQSWHCGCR